MMSASDAREILGLSPNFTDDELRSAYKKAAIANHPDKGGSTTKMQQINVAREVLAQVTNRSTSSSRQYDYEPDTDGYDEEIPPHPYTRNIRKAEVYELFRKYFKAEIKALSPSGPEIRIPLSGERNVDTIFMLIIKRQQTMLGDEYVVRGIGQYKRGIGMKMIMRFSNEEYDMVFWESRNSVMWIVDKLQDVIKSATTQNNFNTHAIKAVLKEYKKNERRIDPNIRS